MHWVTMASSTNTEFELNWTLRDCLLSKFWRTENLQNYSTSHPSVLCHKLLPWIPHTLGWLVCNAFAWWADLNPEKSNCKTTDFVCNWFSVKDLKSDHTNSARSSVVDAESCYKQKEEPSRLITKIFTTFNRLAIINYNFPDSNTYTLFL